MNLVLKWHTDLDTIDNALEYGKRICRLGYAVVIDVEQGIQDTQMQFVVKVYR